MNGAIIAWARVEGAPPRLGGGVRVLFYGHGLGRPGLWRVL